MVVSLFSVFKYNFLASPTETYSWEVTFKNFQSDSENLVLSKIYADKYGYDMSYGLERSYLYDQKTNEPVSTIEPLVDALSKREEIDGIEFSTYTSQIGLQGYTYSFLYNKLHIPVHVLQSINCLILAIVLTEICFLLAKKYGNLLGTVFFVTFFLSPWVVAFARNLYWVEFTWFLPALFTLKLSLDQKHKLRYLTLLFLSVLLKCACGYEYISTILVFCASFFVIDFFVAKDKKIKKAIFITAFEVSITALAGFTTVLLLHGFMRGDGSVLEGVKTIYREDIARRTLSVPGSENFLNRSDSYEDVRLTNSINAKISETVKTYFYWNTNVILGIEGQYFNLLIFTSIALLVYNYIKKENNCKRDIVMFIIFGACPLSWFILAKAHSYVHIHMNYVLWYFGFIQVCLYITIKSLLRSLKNVKKVEVE